MERLQPLGYRTSIDEIDLKSRFGADNTNKIEEEYLLRSRLFCYDRNGFKT